MAGMSVFSSPLLLGFDQIERVIDRASKKSSEGYPPYNIEQVDQHSLRISLAVAGFSDDDLAVTVEDNQLVVRGRINEDASEKIYIHRGIASRQFNRSFVLAEGIEVQTAGLDNGLLHIDLRRPIPEPKVTEIKINKVGKNKTSPKTIEQ
ncbi:MAG: heat-shock protein Hsp20 [Rhodospirillaceae bacterium]|nr:heat-shock protein Hsp20 [Rhodospirillaceae bacterium]|tara:strand:+ start:271 stop:720 length:450 start_codon:yes stop_codon:yes gene_type:complete